jgi:pimeloyl-ACP methyl ester carboxylesterase
MKQRYIEEVEERYVRPRYPVQIIWGRDDAWIALEQGHKLADRIAGGKLISVPNTGHLVQEDAPEAIIAAVLAPSN